MIINLTGLGSVEAIALNYGISVDDTLWLMEATIELDAQSVITQMQAGDVFATFDAGLGADANFYVETVSRSTSFERRGDYCTITGRSTQRYAVEPYGESTEFGFTDVTKSITDTIAAIKTAYSYSGLINYMGDAWDVGGQSIQHNGSMMALLSELAEASGCTVVPSLTNDSITLSKRYPDTGSPVVNYTIHDAVSDTIEYNTRPALSSAIVEGTVYNVNAVVSLTPAQSGGTTTISSKYTLGSNSIKNLASIPLIESTIRYKITITVPFVAAVAQPPSLASYDNGYNKYVGVITDWQARYSYNNEQTVIKMETYEVLPTEVDINYNNEVTVDLMDFSQITDNVPADGSPTGSSSASTSFAWNSPDVSSLPDSSDLYYGVAPAPNGLAYAVPYKANQWLKIDSINNSASLVGASLGSNPLMTGCAYHAALNRVFAFNNSGTIEWIDVSTDTTLSTPITYPAGVSYVVQAQPVQCHDGHYRIFSACNASGLTVITIDGDTGAVSTEFWAGQPNVSQFYTPHPDGYIYSSTMFGNVYKIDIDSKTVTPFASCSSANGICVGADQKLYMAGTDEDHAIIIVDTVTAAVTEIDLSDSLSGTTHSWSSAALAANGNIFISPKRSNRVIEYRPFDGSFALYNANASTTGADHFEGLAYTSDGRLFSAPRDKGNILVINPDAGNPAYWDSPYSNIF